MEIFRASEQVISQAKRPRIAFLTNTITDSRTCEVWSGAIDAVESRGGHLICFPAGLMNTVEHMQNDQRAVLCNLIDPGEIDGLITFQWWSEKEWFEQICSPYFSVPVITIMRYFEGRCPGILIDPYQDMRLELLHLLKIHGYRHIGFARGPETNPYADARYQAYCDVLNEFNVPFDSRLVCVVSPDAVSFSQESSGEKVIHTLFDRRGLQAGLDLEVIVAFNDQVAVEVIKELQKRHIRVPSDMAVVGFDNLPKAEQTFPPVTTVAIPWYELGRNAVAMLYRRLAGDETKEREILSSKLIVRQSCGCLDPSIQYAACELEPEALSPSSVSVRGIQKQIRAQLTHAMRKVYRGSGGPICWIDTLLDMFWRELDLDRSSPDSQTFLRMLEENLAEMRSADIVEEIGHYFLSVLRNEWVSLLPCDSQQKRRGENLLHQGRVLVSRMARQLQMRSHRELEQRITIIHEINQRFLHTFDVAGAMDIFAQALPLLKLPGCYISMYEEPQPYCYPQEISEWSRLILAYDQRGRIDLPRDDGLRFLSRQLVPEKILSGVLPSHWLVEPLYSWEEQIGFVVFEVGPRSSKLYELLRSEVSNMLKATMFVRERQKTEKTLRESLLTLQIAQEQLIQSEKMAALGGLVAGVAHEVNTPLGIGVTAASHFEQETHKMNMSYNREQMTRSSFERYLRTASQSASIILTNLERAAELIQSFKQVSVDQTSETKRRFHLQSFLNDILLSLQSEFRKRQHCTISLLCADTIELISYPGAFAQIVTNFIMNSFLHAFTPDVQGEIRLEASQDGKMLHFIYRDNGSGIPQEQLSHIFEPFYTTKRGRGGSGLGLYIVYNLVTQRLQGHITCESTLGEGTAFYLEIPLIIE